MRYLIIGGSGLLGFELVKRLARNNEVAFTYLNNNNLNTRGSESYKIDLGDSGAIINLVNQLKPSVVIHCASNPSVDWFEKDKESAYKLTISTTKNLAQLTSKIHSKLIYISSAFVFPSINQIFTEADIPAPINFYGCCKLGGELASQLNKNHLIIRTDQIYGWGVKGQKKSFVEGTLEKLEKGERVEVCEDWFNSPTYVEDLAEAVIKLNSLDKKGIYHVVGSDFLNRYEWAKKIAHVFGKDGSLIAPISSKKLNLPAIRPNAHVSNQKISIETGIHLMGVEEGLNTLLSKKGMDK